MTETKNQLEKKECKDIGKREIWRPIKGYEGIYEISHLGRIKSLSRFTYQNHWIKEKILSPSICCGYLVAGLSKNGITKCYKYHRLLAIAFIPNPNSLPQINHKDGDKQNNNLENLEWCDCQHNVKHAFANGLKFGAVWSKEKRISVGKYSLKLANKIRSDYQTNLYTHRELSIKYCVSRTTVGQILLNRVYLN